MRIIGGSHKGRVIQTPRDLPVRPTTDFAREAIFNVLHNRFELPSCLVLDLFSGTGLISLEFASRGAASVTSVEKHGRCCAHIKKTLALFDFPVHLVKADVFDFLQQATGSYHLIFADPPYDMGREEEIHKLVFDRMLLEPSGWLILEHGKGKDLSGLPGFLQERNYGGVYFSIFSREEA